MDEDHRFRGRRPVRLGDVNGTGRVRLDAVARYLQDVATDDAVDAGLADGWVLRRLELRVDSFPQFRDVVELETWCSGTAASAAERCTTLAVPACGNTDGVAVDAVALWVFVGRDNRPVRLDRSRFVDRYGPVVDRKVHTRLRLGDPPPDAAARPWPVRAADVDVLQHVNNTISLAALEDALAAAGLATAPPPWRVEVEYRAAIEPGDAPQLVTAADAAGGVAGGLGVWLVCDGTVRTAMHVSAATPASP